MDEDGCREDRQSDLEEMVGEEGLEAAGAHLGRCTDVLIRSCYSGLLKELSREVVWTDN